MQTSGAQRGDVLDSKSGQDAQAYFPMIAAHKMGGVSVDYSQRDDSVTT